MPGIDGYETTRRLRAREAARGGRRTPVVAMTAAALDDERQRALDAGLDDYLTKPVTGARIAAVIERWVTGGPGAPAIPEPGGQTPGVAMVEASEPGEPVVLDAVRLEELYSLIAGGGYLRRALESFLERVPQLVADVRDATDPDALSEAAHALRGSAANLGALRVSAVAEALEGRGIEGQVADPARLAALGPAIAATTAALRDYRARAFPAGDSSSGVPGS